MTFEKSAETFQKALLETCDRLGASYGGKRIVICDRGGKFEFFVGVFQGNGSPGPILKSAKAATLADVRKTVREWYPATWFERLAFLEEPVGSRNRRWVVLDLETLSPRVVTGRIVAHEYSTVPEAVAA